MLREFVGDLLLRVEVPPDFPGLYVAGPMRTYWKRSTSGGGAARPST